MRWSIHAPRWIGLRDGRTEIAFLEGDDLQGFEQLPVGLDELG